MSLASARGLGGAGQALIGIGEGIMQVGGIDAQNRAEEVKVAALNSTQRMESDMQMYRWGSESDTQKEQFERTQSESEAARASQDEANRLQREQNLILQSRGLDIEEKKVTADISIQLKRFGLQEDKFGLLEKEYEDRKEMSLKDFTLREKQFFHAVAIDKANVAISEGRLDIAQKELDLAKKAQVHREVVDLRKLDQTDSSLKENIRQFNENIAIRKAEQALNKAKIEAGIENDDERLKIEERIATIREELAVLERDKFGLDEKQMLMDYQYKQALVTLQKQGNYLKSRGLKIEEDKLQIAQDKSDREKWEFIKMPVYDWREVEETDSNGVTTREKKYVEVGKRIVAINVDNPELGEIGVLQTNPDGSHYWTNVKEDGELSAIQGMQSDLTALMTGNKEAGVEGMSYEAALKALKTQSPDYDWDLLDKINQGGAGLLKTKPGMLDDNSGNGNTNSSVVNQANSATSTSDTTTPPPATDPEIVALYDMYTKEVNKRFSSTKSAGAIRYMQKQMQVLKSRNKNGRNDKKIAAYQTLIAEWKERADQ